MPFASEYRRGMGFPKEGEVVAGFSVESVRVEHVSVSRGRYEYPTEIIVKGKGGKMKVRKAFRKFFDTRKTLFSGYGNPYQCMPGKMEIEGLDEGRFSIKARGTCVRVYLRDELNRFIQYLLENRYLANRMDNAERQHMIEDYLKKYQTVSVS